jgi:hypothetical protein
MKTQKTCREENPSTRLVHSLRFMVQRIEELCEGLEYGDGGRTLNEEEKELAKMALMPGLKMAQEEIRYMILAGASPGAIQERRDDMQSIFDMIMDL